MTVMGRMGGGMAMGQPLRRGGALLPLAALQAALAGSVNSAIWDLRSAALDGGTLTAADSNTGANPLVQATGANQPAIDAGLGAVMDATDALLGSTGLGATYSVIMAATMTLPASATGTLLANGLSIAAAQQAAINALVGTWTVDEVAVATRQELRTALEVPGQHVLAGYGISSSGWSSFSIGRAGANSFVGSIRCVARIDEGAVTGAALTAARARAKAWVVAA